MVTQVNEANVYSIDWSTWRPVDHAVIVFVRQDAQLLLIRKKRGLGMGKINGPGGRLEQGESYLDAAIRETQEEVGIRPHTLRRGADLSFVFTDGYSLYGEVFLAAGYTGTVVATDEADPFWCPIDAIPYEQMWEDDKLWLPHVLDGAYVSARFVFQDDEIKSREISVLPPADSLNAGTPASPQSF